MWPVETSLRCGPSCERVGPVPAWDLELVLDVTSTERVQGQPNSLALDPHLWVCGVLLSCDMCPSSPRTSSPEGRAVTCIMFTMPGT